MTSSRDATRAASRVDRLLQSLGVDPAFAEDVLGDLAEEYAERAARGGRVAARLWCAREALRAAPHLAWNAALHGGSRERARLAALGAGVALTLAVAAGAVAMRKGPPDRLVVSDRNAADGIVVNDVRPVPLPVRVLDAAGRALKPDGVRFRWESGAPLAVSSQGVVKCTQRGDATVRASIGAIATRLDVRCRPVREIEAASWISLVAGGEPRELPFNAVGTDGRPVMQLRGTVRVRDSSIATLEGATIRPLSVGETVVTLNVGDQEARIRVVVHEPVRTLAALRPDQRLVAVPVRLARGDTVRWPLPTGAFVLKYLPRRAGEAPPTITLDGSAGCNAGSPLRTFVLSDEYGLFCVVRAEGAGVTLAHGELGAPVVEGALALERARGP